MNSDSARRICGAEALEAYCRACREQSRSIVLATGAFDLLHAGHLRFLEKASEYGDVLVVAINDDAYVRRTKGAGRPMLDEQERAYLVAGLRCVNRVHIIRKDLIRIVQPDVFLMSTSSMQKPVDRTEHFALVERYGGRVVVMEPFSETHSSDLIERLGRSTSS